jgi:hypothetical protein
VHEDDDRLAAATEREAREERISRRRARREGHETEPCCVSHEVSMARRRDPDRDASSFRRVRITARPRPSRMPARAPRPFVPSLVIERNDDERLPRCPGSGRVYGRDAASL